MTLDLSRWTQPLAERYPDKAFIALPRELWPRTGSDLMSASEHWGAAVYLRFVAAQQDPTGRVLQRGYLDGVFVEQPMKEAVSPPAKADAAIDPAMRAFLKRLAKLTASVWAAEVNRQAEANQ